MDPPMIPNISASTSVGRFQRALRETISAVITFDVTAQFPGGGGVVFVVTPLPNQTSGATFENFTQVNPGILLINYKLTHSVPQSDRATVTGAAISPVLNVDPFTPVPLQSDAVLADDQFQEIVIGNGPPQAPGSPDVTVTFSTIILDIPSLTG
jgi:hypothetical protein